MQKRKAVFSGTWYPESSSECELAIQGYLKNFARSSDAISDILPATDPCRAGIVPHAGWHYSGWIACQVFSILMNVNCADMVVIFGKHLYPGDKISFLVNTACETPFGDLKTADEFCFDFLEERSWIQESGDAASLDNTIEVQLPFIRYFCGDIPLVAVGVPPNRDASVLGKALARFARNRGISPIFIGSTDMTHYGPAFGFTTEGHGLEAVSWVKTVNDRKMINAMLAMDEKKILFEALQNKNACCGGAVAATVSAARESGLGSAFELAYATSYDVHPADNFVGYSGLVYL